MAADGNEEKVLAQDTQDTQDTQDSQETQDVWVGDLGCIAVCAVIMALVVALMVAMNQAETRFVTVGDTGSVPNTFTAGPEGVTVELDYDDCCLIDLETNFGSFRVDSGEHTFPANSRVVIKDQGVDWKIVSGGALVETAAAHFVGDLIDKMLIFGLATGVVFVFLWGFIAVAKRLP